MKLTISHTATEKQVAAIGNLLGIEQLGEATGALFACDELDIVLNLELTRQLKLPEAKEPGEEEEVAPEAATESEAEGAPEGAILVTAERFAEIVAATESGRTVTMKRNRRAGEIVSLIDRLWVCVGMGEDVGVATLAEVSHDPGKTLKNQAGHHFECNGESYFLREDAERISIAIAPLEEVIGGAAEPEPKDPFEEEEKEVEPTAEVVDAKIGGSNWAHVDTEFKGILYRISSNGKTANIIRNPGPSGEFVAQDIEVPDQVALLQMLTEFLEAGAAIGSAPEEEAPPASEPPKPAAPSNDRAPRKFDLSLPGGVKALAVFVPDYTEKTDFFNIRFEDGTYCRAFPTQAEVEEWGSVEVCAHALASQHLAAEAK